MIRAPIRTALCLLVAVSAWPARAQPNVRWIENPEVLVPASADKPLLLFFHQPGDRTAQRMFTWTFTDPRVAEAAQDFTAISIDMTAGPNMTEHFGVAESPTLLAVTPTQRVLGRHSGHLSAEETLDFLINAIDEVAAIEEMEAQFYDEEPPGEETADEENAALFLESPDTQPSQSTAGFVRGGRTIVPEHRPVAFAPRGRSVPIQVVVPSGGARVTLHWRRPGTAVFNDVRLTPNTPELLYGVIPADAVTPHGLEYYITVAIENQSLTLPPEGPGSPHRIGVR